jgi:phosphoserine phosphatase
LHALLQGRGEEVAEWTRRAMGGSVPFQDAIAARLDILKPSQQQVQALVDDAAAFGVSGV